MSTKNPIHPGEILLEEFLRPHGISANKLALGLRVPANRITGIVNETRSVTADTALRLGKYFGTGAEFWLNLQKLYELETAKAEHGEEIERSVMALA